MQRNGTHRLRQNPYFAQVVGFALTCIPGFSAFRNAVPGQQVVGFATLHPLYIPTYISGFSAFRNAAPDQVKINNHLSVLL